MKSLKLNQLEQQNLSAREMQSIQGGQTIRVCNCSCYYVGSGGSSIAANSSANFGIGSGGGSSKKGDTKQTEIEITY